MFETKKSATGPTGSGGTASIASVADILENESTNVIKEWLERVEKESDLMKIKLDYEERTGHLPQLPHDVIALLRLDAGSEAPIFKVRGHPRGFAA